jgi:hypothetical protein
MAQKRRASGAGGPSPLTEEGKLVGIVARCDILTTLSEPEFVTYL